MEQWFLLGKALRRIHSLAVPAILQNRMGGETYSKTWRETVRALLRRVEEGFTVHDEIAHGLKAFLMEKRDLIQKLVDRAEALGQKLKDMPSEYVLCHADIHGGNVLIDRNNAIYIIDWDEPMMAPKERDLMFIGGGVANVWNKPEEVQWFYQGYGATEINKTQLAYYRHERIVEDIADFCQELLIAPASGADKQTMLKQFIGMFQPKGVVDIAFKSDEDLLL
jgi:spectinomycin phosphotransferase